MLDIDKVILQSKPGDPAACETLMDTYYDFVYNLAASFLGDPDEAEDIAQETFIRAALHTDAYEMGTGIKNWLAKVTINLCRDRYRRRRFQQKLNDLLKHVTLHGSEIHPVPEDRLIQNEMQRQVRAAIDGLADRHRMPVLLRYVHNLTVPEIARILDLSEGTVYSRLHYAHLKLRSHLDSLYDESQNSPIPARGSRELE